ncbi:MAG TPA: response regulator [Candidatus Acidoferrales bacterium]|nr:response regulator [Candidatus Acidoferrales bacterium]
MSANTPTVVVVDDDKVIRGLCCRMLEPLGIEILQAEDGTEARELFRSGLEISLLITDVLMPRMTGPQLVESLLPEHPDLQVLYISGYTTGTDDLCRQVRDRGFSFLRKPFTTAQFAGRVREMLTAERESRTGAEGDGPGLVRQP